MLACGTFSAANAVNPDDVPWDEIDQILKESPAGAESGTHPGEPEAKGDAAGTHEAAPVDNVGAQPNAVRESAENPPTADRPAPITPVDLEIAPPASAAAPPSTSPSPDAAAQTVMHPEASPGVVPAPQRTPQSTPSATPSAAVPQETHPIVSTRPFRRRPSPRRPRHGQPPRQSSLTATFSICQSPATWRRMPK
jgi:hypothetical protein